MGRPIKKGLDYFPLDVDIFSDEKIRIARGTYGNDAIVVYIYLLTRIFRNGYFLQLTDDSYSLFADDLKMSEELTRQIVVNLCKRSMLFDSTLFTSVNALTSPGIQRRFQMAIKTRAQKNAVAVEGSLWLLEKNETEPFIKCTHDDSYSEKNPSYSEKKPSYSEKYDIKESKVKESIVKKRKGDADASQSAGAPSSEDIEELVSKYGKAAVDNALGEAKKRNAYRLSYIKGILKRTGYCIDDLFGGE